ncbi:MAG: molybdate ABC transporter substrate-binding protein [Aquificae bacterium]|nr:molybdate ABC transporter substrate-binding protein [Aquificota bacterium]
MINIVPLMLCLLMITTSFAKSIIIAVSANAQYAVDEIINTFKKENPKVDIKKVVSSSGKLTNQIIKGAPFDIFLSADMKYPNYLYKKGYTINKPKVYAYGLIVLWTLKPLPLKKEKLNILQKVKKIAVANPRTAPYGRESINIIKKLGILEQIKTKIIFGESISQVNYYIIKKLVDVGFTSKSSVLSPKMKNKGIWVEVDKNLYKPIEQGAVLLKTAKDKKSAYTFFEFLFSSKGKKIFEKYGYLIKQ